MIVDSLKEYCSIFLHDHFNPRDGRRAESALRAEFIPGEAPPAPEQEASSNIILALKDRSQPRLKDYRGIWGEIWASGPLQQIQRGPDSNRITPGTM